MILRSTGDRRLGEKNNKGEVKDTIIVVIDMPDEYSRFYNYACN